ncbi:restriction endonuclease subunit S [Moraxella sp. RCAD0137]|uniref:restriction endonuclease subunit S n=1 Tax=Moraxella sp. RCAD0137 TaxID=1775913 RepID=UPI0018EB406D|nr:restriction endonuclease subunit S [Moraxella sp. RCAD0137]
MKLIDLSINISSGITPLRSNNEFWSNGTIPWLKTEQLGEKYIFDTSEYISQKALEETNIKIFPENTLSIAMYGEGKTRGNVSILKRAMTTNQACCNIELNTEKANPEYVYYFLKTQYENLRSLSSGIRKNLNSNDIKSFQIRVPDLPTQQSIASVLSALDQKIAVNNQINAQLEQMAKTLYDYWFVQFDFPDENGKPYQSSGGEMVYNDTLKRVIPKGWEVIELGKCLDKIPNTEKILNKDIVNFGKYPVIDQSQDFICGFTNNQKSILTPDDAHIIFGDHTRTVKLVNFTYARGADGTQIIISNNNRLPSYLLYQMINQIDLSNYGYARHFKFLKESIIILPSKSIAHKYNEIASCLFKKNRSNIIQNQQLTQLRDFLLPMLMNGQVAVDTNA